MRTARTRRVLVLLGLAVGALAAAAQPVAPVGRESAGESRRLDDSGTSHSGSSSSSGSDVGWDAGIEAGRAAPSADPVPIMPMGDSITGSPGCWRGNLWQLLADAGRDVDFVGSQDQGCSPTGSDPDNEGHGGYLVTSSVANGDIRRWLELNTPEVLLLHFGTNDVWSNIPPAQILDAYTSVVTDLRRLNPDARILIAQIIPLEPDESFGCPDCGQRAVDLNAQIPGWAAGLSTARSPIVVVDQWTGFDPATDAYDGVHPNDSGNVKIAANWFAALDRILARPIRASSAW